MGGLIAGRSHLMRPILLLLLGTRLSLCRAEHLLHRQR
jgi:hypothetical protein